MYINKELFLNSINYMAWVAVLDIKTCIPCRKQNGRIFSIHGKIQIKPPLHPNCRCFLSIMKALQAGTATIQGLDGADYWLLYYQELPYYYISLEEAKRRGYNPLLGNLNEVAPGMMLIKGVYENREQKLPTAIGRIWYEADINYTNGYRGTDRILFSNDGLVFVTFDHYKTFVEIII